MQLPQDFINKTLGLLGDAEWEEFRMALNEKPTVSVRVNDKHSAAAEMGDAPVPWCNSGRYIDERPNFTLDPLFHAGAYYVQEASSMFVEQALKVCGEPKMVLDLCAAPGGKSTLLRSLLPDDALLVSNDPVKNRANILAENIIKWGHEGCFVSCNFAKDFQRLGALFDVVLVDAPCSGEGMFRRDNPAMEMWSLANVEECAARQREIVQDIWPCVKDGGYVIYSTCTYNTQENEQNVFYFCNELGAEIVEVPTRTEWGIKGSFIADCNKTVGTQSDLNAKKPLGLYHFMPHRTKGEGFFLSVLRKTGESKGVAVSRSKKMHSLPKEYALRLKTSEMVCAEVGKVLYAVRKAHADVVGRLMEVLYPLHLGVGLHETKGRKQVPHHSLAMSRLIANGAYPTAELSLDEALAYLRHEAIKVDAERGYVLVTYKGLPLGFVNNLGQRANNLYPSEWRIRH